MIAIFYDRYQIWAKIYTNMRSVGKGVCRDLLQYLIQYTTAACPVETHYSVPNKILLQQSLQTLPADLPALLQHYCSTTAALPNLCHPCAATAQRPDWAAHAAPALAQLNIKMVI